MEIGAGASAAISVAGRLTLRSNRGYTDGNENYASLCVQMPYPDLRDEALDILRGGSIQFCQLRGIENANFTTDFGRVDLAV